ncbi:phosphoribosylanthranilate isomerase [Gracilibacillus boraciitolerans JCM 21714]|uniref:N-(5'-phosphoribosyl)anthranilate isomerase n=1 Tax=Gracilibacillus boraciitolerans JCM 21714 TaxID=1298598 RepID=W4VNG2_9BACI|nr:phosphoribosylanthranilate isomerase [Gracilibacillus boraciitolerans]GAE94383.1 phosphoribosylanthranilate isomerase [Gracilibacillus boraciitolerans JCM 21714]
MVQVKICGLKNKEAIEAAANNGADFIGFVFAKSKRRVTKDEATKLAQYVPDHVKKVGVFVNETSENIQAIAREVGLDYIQLHGDETPEFCKELGLPVIKAFEVKEASDLDKISAYDCAYYLLDSPAGKYRGGSGETFDWSIVKEYDFLSKKILLAGGLRADNIQKAIAEVAPAGVDVSSGVETDGEKDLEKIQAFLYAAKKGDSNGKISTTR